MRSKDKVANVRFEDWEAERMQDPGFRAAAEELEPAYQVARSRLLRRAHMTETVRRMVKAMQRAGSKAF
jgi:hypothetical protein